MKSSWLGSRAPLAVALLLFSSVCAVGCSPHAASASPPPAKVARASPAPPPPEAPDEPRHVYRLDFVLTVAGETKPTTFTLNLAEGEHGQVVLGENVVVPSPGSGPSPRQNVGLKVDALLREIDDDAILTVTTEIRALEPPSNVRKVSASGSVLVAPGASALVARLDEHQKRYELTVTPTMLR